MRVPISPIRNVRISKLLHFSRAFTLLELMIVVVIMGLVYSMVTMNFDQNSKQSHSLGPETIASFLRSSKEHPRLQFFIYGDSCDQALFDPPLEEHAIESISFSKELLVYDKDAYGTLTPKVYAPLHVDDQDEKVCLKITKHENDSVTPLLFKNQNFYYYIDPYFAKTQKFSSLESALQAIQKSSINPSFLGLRRP